MDGHRDRLLRRGDYIWGSFIKPERVDGYVVGVNPGDRADVLGRFAFSEGSVDDAVGAASRGSVLWRRTRLSDRAAAGRRFRDGLARFQERFAVLITRETGKPLWEARQEVIASIRAVDLLLEEGMGLLEPRILDEREARSDFRPRGVVGVITPYNLPLLLPVLHTMAALLSGNTVVFKPSKFTPGVGQGVAEVIDRCRLPRGVFNMVQGSGTGIGQRIATHPGLDALLFTGSFRTAMAIRRATFERPELPTLYQNGGKGAALVLEDCDMDRAVYETLVGAFLTAGQRHTSTARVIVHRKVFDQFCEQLVRRAAVLEVGYGFEPETFMGPVISENYRTRCRRYGRAIVARGHQALLESSNREVVGRRGFYLNPAVYWVNWENGHGFLNEEPPGPTVMIYRVNSWEEGVALHNQLIYRLSTSVFASSSNPRIEDIVTRLKTGAINLNRGTIGASLRLPSVGLGRSSNGIPSGIDLLRFLSTPRSTLVERRPFDPSQVVPGIHWDQLADTPDISGELVPEFM
ncbi:MAG: aldehyde dehydrogenase family protein [Deltaproteobacteria bacterium]|nr:aldehyde dehydrogenase family protein [Deltaproteobacteria bacterium]